MRSLSAPSVRRSLRRSIIALTIAVPLSVLNPNAAWATNPVALAPPTTMNSLGATLNWTQYADPEPFVSYEVHRSTVSSFVPNAATRLTTISSVSTTTYGDQTGFAESTYYYKVLANGVPSNEQEVVLPPTGQEEQVIYATETTFIHNYLDQRGIDMTICPNQGGASVLHVTREPGIYGGGPYHSRALVKFDVSSIPAGAFLTDAVLQVWNQRIESTTTTEIHRVTQAWLEGSSPFEADTCPAADGATWTSRQPGLNWSSPGGDFDATVEDSVDPPTVPIEHWDEFEIDDLVVDWIDGIQPNYGLMLKQSVEPGMSDGGIYSSDDGTIAEKRPRLVVSYYTGELPRGIVSELEDEAGVPIGDPVGNFGGYAFYRGWHTPIFGVRASIRNPSTDFSLPNRSLGTFRVVAEIDVVSGYALQVGLTQTRASNCRHGQGGGRSHTTYSWEVVVAGQFLCHWLDNDPPYVYGDTNLFTVLRISTVCQGSSSGPYFWEARINGVGKFCASMPNRRPHVARAGGEVSAGSVLRDADMSACYGCGTSTPWQRAKTTEGGWSNLVRRNIGRATIGRDNTTGNWQIGSLPRWSISNPG